MFRIYVSLRSGYKSFMSAITTGRWWTKKITRTGVALAGAAGLPWHAFSEPRAYALTYHRIGRVPRDPFCVSRPDFERQIGALAKQKRAVGLEDIEAFARGERRMKQHTCLITIDDGMVSTLEHAVPILAQHGVPAALFVSSNLIGRNIAGAEEPYMSWSQLREVAALPGITIGSHAHTHRSLGALTRLEARCEIETSKKVLEDQLGAPVRSFAYPFGTTGDFNEATDALLKEAGFTVAFNSIHGAIRQGMSPVSLPRVKVEGGEPQPLFELVSRGATLPWQVVDRHLWRFQRIREERS